MTAEDGKEETSPVNDGIYPFLPLFSLGRVKAGDVLQSLWPV